MNKQVKKSLDGNCNAEIKGNHMEERLIVLFNLGVGRDMSRGGLFEDVTFKQRPEVKKESQAYTQGYMTGMNIV